MVISFILFLIFTQSICMLKNLVSVLSLLLFAASYSNAQNFSFGVKGGGGLNKMNFENFSPDYETDFGYSFGIPGNYKFTQIFSLEADLFYVQKGTKYNVPGYHFSYTLEYISLPVLAKFYMPMESAFKPFLNLGTSVNYLISNQKGIKRIMEPDKTYPFNYDPSETDYTSKTKSLDYGIIAGAGLDCSLFSHTISLEARYEIGLTDINKSI